MFEPPFCPSEQCPHHRNPPPNFCRKWGTYSAHCRVGRVQRFRCNACRRTFSIQTFRHDYREKKPEVNAAVVELLCSGSSLRGTARQLRISRRCLELKARKIARACRALDRALRSRCRALEHQSHVEMHFDEFETYEERRTTRPITVATCIDSVTRFHYGVEVAPIRPGGIKPPARAKAIAEDALRFGQRPSRSKAACSKALGSASEWLGPDTQVVLNTDEKSSYPKLARRAFGDRLLSHVTTNSRAPRGAGTPMFPINHEEADMRDKLGRLMRRSWRASKRRWFLGLQLGLYSAYRNWSKPRFNGESCTPAQFLGLVGRRLVTSELVGWRQQWGERSPCPFSLPAGSRSGGLGYRLRRRSLAA